jgi:two-component system, OmpR family, response regulator
VAILGAPESVQHPRVLVVDDDANVVNLLSTSLQFQGFEVDTATNGPVALDRAHEVRPDVVVLDVTLPDGFGVLRQMRADRIHTPVLFLTARDSLQDRITGLSIGADDYITKPFSLEEVIARLRAVLRRTGVGARKPRTARLVFADIELDEDTRKVSRAGVPVSLSPTEFALLRYFVVNAGIVLSKQRILDHVWSHNFGGNAGCVECYISYLRRKIDTDDDRRLLHTLRGVGYVLREPRSQDQRSSRTDAAREAQPQPIAST